MRVDSGVFDILSLLRAIHSFVRSFGVWDLGFDVLGKEEKEKRRRRRGWTFFGRLGLFGRKDFEGRG